MRSLLTTCFLVLLLLWELNATTSLSPSTPTQHGGSSESHGSSSRRSEGPTTLLTSDEPTTELKPEHGELNNAMSLSPSTSSQHGGSSESHRSSSRSKGPTTLLTRDEPTTELKPEHGELNAMSLSPSTPNQQEGSFESHRSSSRSEGPTTLLTSDEPTTELRPQHGVSSSKRPTHFPLKQNLTGTSHAEHKTTETQATKEENESPSSTFSLATSKGQTKRSLEYSTESQEPSTDKKSTILATRDHNQHSTSGVTSSKQSADSSQALMTSGSHAKRETTKVQITTSESKSPSHASSLITSRRHTKRSLVTSENKQTTSTPAKLKVTDISTAEKEHRTSQEVKSTENTSITGNLLKTSMSHAERKTTEIHITTGESKSPSHSSSLSTLRQHTKRSLLTPENNQTTTTPAKLNEMNATTAEKEHQTSNKSQEVTSMGNNSITGNLQETISNSTEKVVTQQTNTTTPLSTTQRVVTDEPVKVSADHQTKVQTTARSPQAQENGDTNATTFTTVAMPNTTKPSKNISEVTTKAQTSGSVLPISTSTTNATFIANTSMASTGPSKGSTTGPATRPTTGSTTGPSTGHSTSSSTGFSTRPVTDETATTSVTTVGKTPTAAPTSSPTTQPTKKTTTSKKILPVIPDNSDQSNAKKNNTGPIVASLIGTALVLMFIAIAVILFRKRRMQKRQLDNPDWAGPSPFLESDIQANSSKQGDEELFPTKRDAKRISLHSFLPQRLSQRLSLLVEEDVQMNDMVVNSTFGKNENSQNGKPTVQQGEEQEQDQDQDQDKSQDQKLTDAQTPDVVSSAPGAPETADKPAAPVDNGTIQPKSTPGEEITSPTSPSTETSAAPPTPPPFEDVDLSLPQTNPANTSPAPQT